MKGYGLALWASLNQRVESLVRSESGKKEKAGVLLVPRQREPIIFYTDTGSVEAEERSASGSRLRQVGSTSSACHSPTTT